MNILTLLIENIARGPSTVRFPQRPMTPAGYRGLVQYDPALCTGCATCSAVCTSSAIKFRSRRDNFQWSYDAAQCTFCGRCMDGCEAKAITMECTPPPVYVVSGSLKQAHTIQRQKPGAKK